ncbi:hypothetical protein WA158_000948 [Blastocystis sp. Blastoise]
MRIATLSDLKNNNNKKNDKKDDLYAGGIDSHGHGSGIAIRGETDTQFKITMYRNGFRVNDGPFRALDNEENKAFYDSVQKRYIPKELEQYAEDDQFAIDLDDHMSEDFVVVTNWHGDGHNLSSAPIESEQVKPIDNSNRSVIVDDSKEKYIIRVRLHNGTTHNISLNSSHTLNDLYYVVATYTPNINFNLLNGIPPTALPHSEQSLQEMKLNRATLTQRKI